MLIVKVNNIREQINPKENNDFCTLIQTMNYLKILFKQKLEIL